MFVEVSLFDFEVGGKGQVICEVFNVVVGVDSVEFLGELVKLVQELYVPAVLECYLVLVEFPLKKQVMDKVQCSEPFFSAHYAGKDLFDLQELEFIHIYLA